MSNFELTIQFTKSDTQKLNDAGYVVAFIKDVYLSDVPKPLWATLAPFETNTFAFQDEYGLYASPDPVQRDTVITAFSSQFPAQSGVIYPFDDNVFLPPAGSVDPKQFAIANKTPGALTFGLMQEATANGRSVVAPATAVSVLAQQQVVFEPTDTVSVFMYQKTVTGTAVIISESVALAVDMAADPTQTIHFDGIKFVPGPLV